MNAPAILLTLWTATWQAGLIATAIVAISIVTRDRLPPAWRAALWLVVAVRLSLPALPHSPVGLFRSAEPTPAEVVRWPTLFVSEPAETATGVAAAARPSIPAAVRPADGLTFAAGLLALWAAGVLTFAVGTAVAHLRFARRVRRSAVPASGTVLAALSDTVGTRKLPPAVVGPALFGVVRPRLLLPPDLDRTLTGPQLRAVLRHELAHVRRLDPLVAAGWHLLRCVHWFNPLAWVAAAGWRAEAELAADAAAARVDAVDGTIQTSLGHALLTLGLSAGRRRPPLALTAVGSRRQLRRRVAALARRAVPPSRGRTAGAVLLLLAVGSAGLTVTSGPTTRPDGSITRTFDVKTLFWEMRVEGRQEAPKADGPATLVTTGPTRAAFDAHQARTKERLLATLRDSVLPGEWDGTASLDDAGHVLAVTAPPAVLDHIATILDRMRADVAVQASIETEVYTLSPAVAGRLPFALPDPDGSPVPLTVDQSHALRNAVAKDAGSTVFTAPRLTLFNHQRTVFVMKTDQAYVAGPKPAGATTAPVGSTTETGIRLDVRMAVDADRRTVAADLRVEYAKLLELQAVQLPGRPADTFQLPRTSTAVVDYHETLAGGVPVLFAADDREQTGRRYYVVLRPVVLPDRRKP